MCSAVHLKDANAVQPNTDTNTFACRCSNSHHKKGEKEEEGEPFACDF